METVKSTAPCQRFFSRLRLLVVSAYGRRCVGLRPNTENSRRTREKPLVPRVPYPLIELFYIGLPVVQADGRSVYGHLITKFFGMGRFYLTMVLRHEIK